MQQHKTLAALALGILLAACNPTGQQGTTYEADIRWTDYGIPHINADDWGSLGFGFAYAVAEDGFCVLAREMIRVRGEMSRYFGPGDGNLASDIFHKGLITAADIDHQHDHVPPQIAAMTQGYIAGYNHYLQQNRQHLPASCNDAPWVRPMTADDMDRIAIGVAIRYGVGAFAPFIAAATPPGDEAGHAALGKGDPDWLFPVGDLGPVSIDDIGSNAYAFGRALTRNGRGVMLGNPHYPWQGPSRFHMAHLTLPGELDFMGVGLFTTTALAIGFNNHVAWSHTVSSALRFTLFELDLTPGNPLQYRDGDSTRTLETRTVAVEVLDDKGEIRTETRKVYMSHLGPVVESDALPWTRQRVYVMRDVNLTNNRSAATYYRMNRAKSVADLKAALEEEQGIAWVNTIAADRHGNAFYGDISVVANVDGAQIRRCASEHVSEIRGRRVIVLRGSVPGCNWRVDDNAADAGIMPPAMLPSLTTDTYVSNSNDSYWLSNPEQRLEGYSPIIGDEGTARSLRTRAGLVFVEEALRDGGKIGADTVQDIMFNHRNHGAEVVLDDLLKFCGQARDLTEACDILAAWDRRMDIGSVGGHIFIEFWREAAAIKDVFDVPFDINDPVHTPRGLAAGKQREILDALRTAVARLEEHDIALDAPWGELQYVERNGEKIAVPGGPGTSGMFSNIIANLVKGAGYTPVFHGNSYIQVVTWNEDGSPDARAILTYSQSQEPESPHHADMTRLYEKSRWVQLPFTDEQIEAGKIREMTVRGK